MSRNDMDMEQKNMEKNIDQKELRQKEEAAWTAYIHHWHEVIPRKDFNETMESGKAFEAAQKALEESGGSWEKLKIQKEKEIFEKK